MSDGRIFGIIITVIICVTALIGGAIGHSIITTNYTKELIASSLEKGQNPLYVKCSMESNTSSECRILITALSLSGQVKETLPVQDKTTTKK